MTVKGASEAKNALFARLAQALNAGDDALRAVLSELGMAEAERARFSNAALQLGQRARAQASQPSATELELALGVLWVLHAKRSTSHTPETP